MGEPTAHCWEEAGRGGGVQQHWEGGTTALYKKEGNSTITLAERQQNKNKSNFTKGEVAAQGGGITALSTVEHNSSRREPTTPEALVFVDL